MRSRRLRRRHTDEGGMNMPAILEGKVALVTGVSHDGQIGQTVAKKLADNDAALAICARTQSNVEARAEELRQAGARVLPVAAALSDESQVRRLIERVLSDYKRIDILVNLAGRLTRFKPAVEHSLEDWNEELNNNLLSAFLTSRAVFPHMQEAGGGVIINFARSPHRRSNTASTSFQCRRMNGPRFEVIRRSDAPTRKTNGISPVPTRSG